MKPTVYLADLRYNYSGVLANDCMPLGVAYIKAVMDMAVPDVQSRLFAYPDRLWDAIYENPPDILMVSNYLWNEALSFHFAKLVKSMRPETLVVMGGPNIPVESPRQIAFFEAHPEIDLYVLGEADFLASEVTQAFLDSGLSIAELGRREIPSAIYRRPGGATVMTPMWDRKRNVDDIPSPWLTGIQDEFFDGKLAPMIETNRGCPFSCAFCIQGLEWYTKVNNFSMDRMKEEIEYIARRIKAVCPNFGTLRIADSNYGMFERDVEISGWIGEMQKRYGYPTFIDATTGKNRADRIIRSVEKVSGALVVYQAVQSLNDDVLRNIKRANIKLDTYEEVMIHIRGRGLRSNSDLIVGLPGETLKSHTKAIHTLIDAGTNQMHNLQLILLKGSELEMIETRKKFNFQTRFRVLPKNFGIYGFKKVLDVEELVVSTDTMSFDDYIQTRKWHLVSSVFYNDSWYEDAVAFAEKLGVKRSEWFNAMLAALENSTGAAREFLDSFVGETKGELFMTPEECVAFYSEENNFRRLLNGDIGDNLMYKYRAIASFKIWPDMCKVAMDATRQMLEARGASRDIPDFESFWKDLHAFVQHKHADGRDEAQILRPVQVAMSFDIAQWIAGGMSLDLAPYKLDQPEIFEFRLSEKGARELKAALEVWTTTLKGLTKMVTRIQMAWQRRTSVPVGRHANEEKMAFAAGASHGGLLPEQW